MSYTRQYREIVSKTVSKTVSVSYPASQNGGSRSVTVDILAEIPVDVNIHVDTNPFDHSVQQCGDNVNLLTSAVVATEAAEIASKNRNSKKVANTIIGGFFSYIRSEISQQVAELSQNIDAQLMHVKSLAQSCIEKKTQMETDYNRISSRYVKVFNDLNNELSNRIFELDKSSFIFKKETDKLKIRTSENDLVNTVAISAAESGDLQSKISASIAKKRAFDTINKAILFLRQQKNLNNAIQLSMLNESISCSMYVPVCFIEKNNAGNKFETIVYGAEYLSALNNKEQKSKLVDQFSSNTVLWRKLTEADQNNIKLYFNTELNSKAISNDQHTIRVREMIQKIAGIGSISAI